MKKIFLKPNSSFKIALSIMSKVGEKCLIIIDDKKIAWNIK